MVVPRAQHTIEDRVVLSLVKEYIGRSGKVVHKVVMVIEEGVTMGQSTSLKLHMTALLLA